MRSGRPPVEPSRQAGKPAMPDWFTDTHRKIWSSVMKRECAKSWGSAQTELVISLVTSIATLQECEMIIATEGVTSTSRTGMRHIHPAVAIAQRERGHLATLSARLGIDVKGGAGKKKGARVGGSAADFLTMIPRDNDNASSGQ